MTMQLDPLGPVDPPDPLYSRDSRTHVGVRGRRPRVGLGEVVARRLTAVAIIAVPVLWALHRSSADDLIKSGGLSRLRQLFGSALEPALAQDFLALVLDAALVTVIYAALGTVLAIAIGAAGALVLSDVTWARTPTWPVRTCRMGLRGLLVAARSIHELVWALLFVSVLGLDPLVAVLAIAVPFGAQTAKIFAETLDGVPPGPLGALRSAGARPVAAMAYSLLPQAMPMLLSYAFYRFECAIRSAVVLGVVGVGGLGQEVVVSLSSRNWDEVWTLIAAILLLSAVVDLWSTRLRADLAVASCSDWSAGQERAWQERAGGRRPRSSAWARASVGFVVAGAAAAWVASDVSLSGLVSPRTRRLTTTLLDDLWPPTLPPGGLSKLVGAVLDTVAMAVLAMVVAVAVTLLVAPLAARMRRSSGDQRNRRPHTEARMPVRVPVRDLLRTLAWALARLLLLVLRSVPPTVWAVVALFVLFPGILPGALALGLYTGGILGRLVAEAWESVDARPRDALLAAGTPRPLAALAAMVPPSMHHLLSYTLYRFEICMRDTAVVGVVGAAGLGRLLAENLAVFRFPALLSLLAASFAVSLAAEVAGRRLRRALAGTQKHG